MSIVRPAPFFDELFAAPVGGVFEGLDSMECCGTFEA
jgi:hypothetical protein